MMVGKIHIWLVVIVTLVHLLEASRITTRDVPIVCGVSSGSDKWSGRQFPWMAAIFSGELIFNVGCGGALISEQYVLTAAQCVFSKVTGLQKSASNLIVRMGDHRMTHDYNSESVYKVAKVIPHSEYDPSTSKNDIALLRLEKAVQLDHVDIGTICLPTPDTLGNQNATMAGWGMKETGQYATNLMYLPVDMVSKGDCQTAFDKVNIIISDSQLCAGHFEGTIGACHGDEGGPLMVSNADGHAAVVGIVSVVQCGKQGLVDIYTNVISYLNWIKKNAQIE